MAIDIMKQHIFTGDDLLELVNSPTIKREPLAEGFIYERSSIMISADPAAGKSCLSLQAALEMSCGIPVFGIFRVPRPVRVYYIQKERPIDEIKERIEYMQGSIPWNASNLCFDKGLQAVNLGERNNRSVLIERFRTFHPDLIIIDPIYAGMNGVNNETVPMFIDFLTAVQHELGCSLWLNHHNTKQTYDNMGRKVVKDKAFYGPQWLLAYVTAYFEASKTSKGTLLKQGKDSHSNLIEKVQLEFDGDNYISRAEQSTMSTDDRLKAFLRSCGEQKKDITITEICSFLGCAKRTAYLKIAHPDIAKTLKRVSAGGSKVYYQFTG